ncbi:MAG TPA: HDIG domain-containing protein [Pyrinomonadaceae bacterium]|jgi:hypothetical protein
MKTRRIGRRPRLTSPLAAWRDAALQTLLRPFRWFRPTTRFVLGFTILSLLTTLLLARTHSQMPAKVYDEGDVVRADIISPADITTEDVRETERRRAAARVATRPVWTYDPTRAESAAQSFRAAWENLRRQQQQQPTPNSSSTPNRNAPDSEREPTWTGAGDARNVSRAIVAHRFDPAALERLTEILRDVASGYIYDGRDAARIEPEIRLIDARTGAQSDIDTRQSRLVSLSEARETLRERLSALSGWTQQERDALASAMLPLLTPTVAFDTQATEAAMNASAGSVSPALVALKRNQIIAREGDTVTPQMLTHFAAIHAYGRTERRPHHFIGLFLIVAALYGAAWRYTEYRSTITTLPISKAKAFTLVSSAILVQLILMRVGFIVADSIAGQSMSAPLSDPTVWSFAIPFAAAALLLTLLIDSQLALITAVLTAIFAGLLAPNGMLITCYAMISSSAAIYGIGRYRERQSVTLAGFFVGVVNAVIALGVILSAQQPLTLNAALLAAACGLLGGLLTTIFTAGGLPINESLFGILTDIKLLELSNADLPVLGQLALRAPGTNQHSHAVGQLAEEACRAIGANALLARIGALYHDIGKTAAPDMFVENQTGENPHDRLRPSQSARIITSHVTYGLKLAKEIGLPKQISDFIPQHHGTRTLHFFLRKAQAHAADDEVVDESEFRYPGPKPQFKEAAIMMLADSCEAAARSLSRPDPENIRTIVTKIFDAIVSDGQLDECDLSLRELTKIRESIITSLTAIYHARIDYPGFNPPSLSPSLTPLPLAELDTEERGVGYTRPSEIPISKGGEVEDEALTGKVKN